MSPADLATRVHEEADMLARRWTADDRWRGIRRPYIARDVVRLRGSLRSQHALAAVGAGRLWRLLHSEKHVAALGALTGNQAVQMVKAGVNAIYLSGWQGGR